MKQKSYFIIILLTLFASSCQYDKIQQLTEWPEVTTEMKPGTRWWWMGSAVDSANISALIQQYAEAGLGSLEVTPIYGVQHNEHAEIPFLSNHWMQMYSYARHEAKRHGMNIALSTGTGWPFGGPSVSLIDAAGRILYERYHLHGGQQLNDTIIAKSRQGQQQAQLLCLMAYNDHTNEKINLTCHVDSSHILRWTAPLGEWTLHAIFNGHTFQKVKRAAIGGEGLVIDHFSKNATQHYLNGFTQAFQNYRDAIPDNFFNDSYEAYNSDITPAIFDEFYKRRGYHLEDFITQLLSNEVNDTICRLRSDYCETLSDLLHDNFTSTWTDWAHTLGSQTRNQAHGSPANLIDIYAAVDIPECEGFGYSGFDIKGLRSDFDYTHSNYSDISMLKYASSAAHISGKHLVSSETFTWLTEHFRTSLSQCKPDLDMLFAAGVNHVYLHGTTYSPINEPWPGWKFYAPIDMSPTNTIWRDANAMFKYIGRCQSFLQMGEADNDFLVYLPIHDIWYGQHKLLLQLEIYRMGSYAPDFVKVIDHINEAGYDVDYSSDRYIMSAYIDNNGSLTTSTGSHYKAIVIPDVKMIPIETLEHLIQLAKDGATIIFAGRYPLDVPGLYRHKQRKKQLVQLATQLPAANFTELQITPLDKGQVITGNNYATLLEAAHVKAEMAKSFYRLQCIRRKNKFGFHYFISNLTNKDIDEFIPLAIDARSFVLFDPMNGNKGKPEVSVAPDGTKSVRLQLASGQSVIIRTITDHFVTAEPFPYITKIVNYSLINKDWNLSFIESYPEVTDTFHLDNLCPWTDINDSRLKVNMGTALYTTTFEAHDTDKYLWSVDLGDVRESARLFINDKFVTTLWAVPFNCDITDFIVEGTNSIAVEVTGLPANHIAQMDRDSIPWRKFKDINFVSINYKKETYDKWKVVACGLNGPVKIIRHYLPSTNSKL